MAEQNTITNKDGQFVSAVGPAAVEAFRLRTLIVGLQAEARMPKGMKLSRVPLKKVAKQITGLKTNDVEKLVAALEVTLATVLSTCEVVDATHAR